MTSCCTMGDHSNQPINLMGELFTGTAASPQVLCSSLSNGRAHSVSDDAMFSD